MGTVTTLYILMCIAITLAVPYYNIDKQAPFSVLFKSFDHWHWASYLVSIGAVLGVGTVLLVGKMCTVRDLLVMSRHGLVPGVLAHISKHTGKPLRMIALYAVVALTTSFETLAKLTNVGSLFVVSMVAGVVLWRRYYKVGSFQSEPLAAWLLLARFVPILGLSIAFTACWNLTFKYGYYVGFGLPVILLGFSFFITEQQYRPEGFKTPLVPLSCTFCIFAAIFLIGSAGYEACYRSHTSYTGVHASEKHSERVHAYLDTQKPGYEAEHADNGKTYTKAAGKFENATQVSVVPTLAVPEARLASNIA